MKTLSPHLRLPLRIDHRCPWDGHQYLKLIYLKFYVFVKALGVKFGIPGAKPVRHYGLKEEFNGLNMSVGLSTSRHNFIPHGRTTSFRVYTNISNSRFESRAPPAPAPKSSPMRGSVVESPNARMP